MASNSLLEGAVFGTNAGESAAAEGRFVPLPRHECRPQDPETSPLLQLDDVLYSLKSLMWRQVGLTRSRDSLTQSIERIGLWHRYVRRSHPFTRRAYELQNMLTTSALITRSALAREESRGTHFREDFTQRDDPAWCRHLTLERDLGGRISVGRGPCLPPTDGDLEAR